MNKNSKNLFYINKKQRYKHIKERMQIRVRKISKKLKD